MKTAVVIAGCILAAATSAAAQPLISYVAQLKTMAVIASPDREPPPGSAGAYYPTAARKAGQEGHVVLRCPIRADGEFVGCAVVEETPKGFGFGDAALAMVRRFRQPIPDPRGGIRHDGFAAVPFFFGLPAMPGLADQLVWDKLPSSLDMRRGRHPGAPGRSTLSCHLQADGALAACQVSDEAPLGYGIGDYGLEVAKHMEFRATLKDGRALPTDAVVRVPLKMGLGGVTVAMGSGLPATTGVPQTGPAPLTPREVAVHLRPGAPTRFFPEVAQKAGVEGDAEVLCTIASDGALTGCQVTAEQPSGCRFGEALVRLAGSMLAAPKAHDGSPTAGRAFRLRSHFALPLGIRRAAATSC